MKKNLLLPVIAFLITVNSFAQGSWTFAAPTDGAGTAGPENGRAICTDASGNVYIVGNFNGSGVATDFDLSSSTTNTATASSVDGFIASYDKNGNFRWKTIVSGSGSDFGVPTGAICTNGTFVWVAGSSNVSGSSPAPTITSSTNSFTITSTGTSVDNFVAKLNCSNGSTVWQKAFGGAGANDFAMGICIDPNGCCYVSGAYSGAFTLDNITAPAINGTISDVYIAKFDPNGIMIRFNSGGSTVQDIVNAGGGLVYVPGAPAVIVATGHTGAATASFGSFTNLTNAGAFDAFLVELDTALASFTNAMVFGSTGSDELLSAVYDAYTGDVFVSGFCSGNITFPGTAALTGFGGQDIVIARYNVATNNFVWSANAGGSANERGWCVTSDNRGGIILSGTSAGTCNFGNGISMPSNAGISDLFVVRYNLSGTPQWILTATSTGTEEARGISSYVETTPSYLQQIFVTGITIGSSVAFGSTTVGNDGGSDFFLARLTDNSAPLFTTWNGSTWSNGVPSSSIDAVIASSTAPASFTCKALTINNGVSLTTTGITATVNGDITNNGNGIAGTGNIVIADNAALQGTAFSFSGNLTVNTGATLTTNDKLTLASDATNTGRVGNSTGSIAGNVTVQRFIPAGRRAFRFLAHPFTSNLALTNLTDDIDITGTGGTPFTTTTTNAPSAFWYNNANGNITTTPTDPGWTALTATSTLNSKTGYRVLLRGTKGQANSLTGGSYTPAAVTLDWTGTLNQGQQVFTLSRANANAQYNLIGNPYACPVDLSLTTRGSSINANFSVWNAQGGTRGAYVTQAFTTPYILPSGSAFFAQTTANTNNTITFDEIDKSTGSATNIFRTTNAEDKLVLELTDANNNYADQLAFYFDDKNKNYTANNDALWDAEKLTNPDANLYSLSKDGKKLAIDRRPLEDNSQIPLGLTHTSNNANFTLTVKEIPSINNNYHLYLNDKWLNTTTLLQANTTIAIAITSNTASQGNNRFEIVTKLKPVLPAATSTFTVSLSPNPANGKTVLTYTQPTAENTTIIITDITGKKVQTINLGKVQNGVQPLNIAKLAAGTYYVQVNNGVETKTEKLIVQ